MRVYQLSYYRNNSEGESDGMGCRLEWHANKADADNALRRLRNTGELSSEGPAGVEPFDIPTTKAGLLIWLNAHYDSDNG